MFPARRVLVQESYERLDCGQQSFWNRRDSVLHASGWSRCLVSEDRLTMAKSSKRMSELRALVLGEIHHQAACRTGMDVSITPDGAGGWRADSIPPTGSIAYADCVDYIAQVAARLRLQYDLTQEPSRELINAPFEESTFNESPADAITRLPVDLADPKERKAWIETQPNEVAWVIAARAALRVLPTMSLESGSIAASRMTRRVMMLRVFRATAAAWAVSAYPSHRDQLRAAARDAIPGLGGVEATIHERAAGPAVAAVLAQVEDVAAL